MNTLTYQQFIDEINNGKIIKAVFQIKDYAHYRCCSIERIIDVFPSGNSMIRIDIRLTKDSERVGFLEKFNEKYKLFDMGRKGTFTLKQMWDRIEFISIDYAP
ncbi:MAG: hypothetical protein J1G05_00795 [Clostridiales bacterium]|nr:hypothetical protein [Clostridiales bacterium]